MVSFLPNTKVRYKADPTIVGWVVSIENDNARVFIEGSLKLIPMSELEAVPQLIEMNPHDFKVALTRRRLENPLTEQLLSYKSSKTHLYYHQFIPVKKILESPEQRLLIADEVGTGKTIEAGLIWAELEARSSHGLENVWIICPKGLVGKWQEEMLQRFDLSLEPLTPEGLRQALVSLDRDGILPPRFAKSVVNLELIRGEDYVSRLGNTSIAWDFVIFDEAHHLRNPETLSYALCRFICERSNAAVFLTATPLQTGLDDIVHLMEGLGIEVAADPQLLEEQIMWDMQLNECIHLLKSRPPGWEIELTSELDRLESNGGQERPGWRKMREFVSKSDLNNPHQRAAIIQATRDIQVLSPYMTRTQRADVDVNRPIREAVTRTVQFTPVEGEFYKQVYQICLTRANSAGVPPGFATQMPERRTASCVSAVAAEILRLTNECEQNDYQAHFSPYEVNVLEPYAKALLNSHDSKYEALLHMLNDSFSNLKADRVMIFSTFRGTLNYLYQKLKEKGYTLDLMYGDTPPRDEDCRKGERSREKIAKEFREGKFQILLASEVAGEGLDFEHCHIIINYDLPWNPMRVEQRIGRCDRLGQQSAKVYVGSLTSIGTIEERVLLRLYQRLHIFERALGDMELILGEQIASFEREVFSLNLSPQQQEERLEKIAQATINIEKQRESLKDSKDLFLAGRQLLESEQQDIKNTESRFIAPKEIAELVFSTIDSNFPDCIKKSSEPEIYEIAGTKEIRDAFKGLLKAYPASHYARIEINRFNRKLEAGKIKLIFWGDPGQSEFVHIRHPLVLLSRWLVRGPQPEIPYCRGLTNNQIINPKLLVWAVGSLEGYTKRVELLSAVVDVNTKNVNSISIEEAQILMQTITPLLKESDSLGNLEDFMIQGEKKLLQQFEESKLIFNERNFVLIEKARQAMTSHSERKLQWLRHQLSKNDLKVNIRNLYRGWSQRLETETRIKIEDINQKSQVKSSLQIIGLVLILPSNNQQIEVINGETLPNVIVAQKD